MSDERSTAVKKHRTGGPTTDAEAQAALDARAPPKSLQKLFDAYKLCGGCQARDALRADSGRVLALLYSLTSSTTTTASAPDVHATIENDCHHIIRHLENPPFYMGPGRADTLAIEHLGNLCYHTECRRVSEIEQPLLRGHFGAGAAARIAEALPAQSMDVVRIIVSYIDIQEVVNPPAANAMFRVYSNHMARFLRTQQDRLERLDASTVVPRRLADMDRIAALYCILTVVTHASMFRSDPQHHAFLSEHERDLAAHLSLLGNSMLCNHTSKETNEWRQAMSNYASALRFAEVQLRAEGFQVSAADKLAELV